MKKYFNLILIISLFFVSCTEPIDFKLKDGHLNALMVDGSVTSENQIQKVILSRSAYFYSDVPTTRETGATVSITDGTHTFEMYDTENNGVYCTSSPVAGITGNNYTLNIGLKTGENYSATSKIIPLGNIDSLSYRYEKSPYNFQETDSIYTIVFYAKEDPTPGNYYMWNVYLNDSLLTDTLSKKIFTDDQFVNGNYVDFDLYTLRDSIIKKDTNNVTVKMYSISKTQYDFMNAVLLETVFKGSPFDGPPANIPTNLSNGALGFFSAMAVRSANLTVYRKKNPHKKIKLR